MIIIKLETVKRTSRHIVPIYTIALKVTPDELVVHEEHSINGLASVHPTGRSQNEGIYCYRYTPFKGDPVELQVPELINAQGHYLFRKQFIEYVQSSF